MINCTKGCWYSNSFNILKTVTYIYLKQVTVQQHVKEILFGEK